MGEVVTKPSNTTETKKITKKSQKSNDWENKSISELKGELQKLKLSVRTAGESDTSKIKKLKKHIARLLTKSNISNN